MWVILKSKKNSLNFLKRELKNKFKKNSEIYSPKMLIENFRNKKLVRREVNIMGDYIFCFNSSFSDKHTLSQVKYVKGVNYFLDGCQSAQKEIEYFVKKFKSCEDEKGYINQNFLNAQINKYYKFLNGPFTQKIFKIIEIHRDKIQILVGNIQTSIDKRKFLFSPL
tara:strand:- start:180 stop:677 length:498 start_codon:yes stop_codon:yes gene_type:complete